MATIDVETDTRSRRHVLTIVCIRYLEINNDSLTYKFDEKYAYDCYDQYGSGTLLEARLGGLGAFVLDLKGSLN